MEDYSFILDGMRWSYSSLNTYETCPASFRMIYLDGYKGGQNAFAEWGSLMHKILERYYTHQIDLFDLIDEYESDYNKYVQHDFPPNRFVKLDEIYKRDGREYLSNFNDPFAEYQVIGVEKRFTTKIDTHDFVGVIDLLLQDKDDERFVICDHKSHKFKNNKEIEKYLRQLYLYSQYVKETYEQLPKRLIFNTLRNPEPVIVDFDESKYIEAVDWARTTIEKIYKDDKFECHSDDFFCSNLCSVNIFCEQSDKYIGEVC